MSNVAIHRAIGSAVTTASAWLLVLLIVAGMANSRSWTDSRTTRPDQSESAAGEYVCNYPLAPGDTGSDMTPDGLPTTEGPAFTALPLLFKTDNSFKRGVPGIASSKSTLSSVGTRDCLGVTPTSLAQVSSRLGRQFTLVGAKPSGTS